MIKRPIFLLGAFLLTAVVSSAAGVAAERSPQAEAIELVSRTAIGDVRKAYPRDWWTDTDVHTWSVRRIFSPGRIDSTHDFFVSYSVNGKLQASWLVNTNSRSVQLDPTPRADAQTQISK
jgi:hypothetical protein